MRAWAPGVPLMCMLIAAPCAAQRSDDDLARAHFESGSAYYEQGRYEEAARAFMEAYELSRRPPLLENAARSYERALLFDEAIRTLEALRELEPDRRAALTDRIEGLRRLQARVGAGGSADDASEPPNDPEGEAVSAAPPPQGSVSVPGVALLTTGGALGIGALITGVLGHLIYEDLSATCPDRVCPASRQADIDTGSGLVISSTVMTFAAPIAAGLGILFLLIDSGSTGEERALTLVPGPGEAGLALEGRL